MSDSATPWTAARQASLSHRQLPEFTQTHVHRVDDAIQPSHPLSSPSPPSCNLSQHQGVFQWVSSLHQVVKVLEFQFQHQSFQWIIRTDFQWTIIFKRRILPNFEFHESNNCHITFVCVTWHRLWCKIRLSINACWVDECFFTGT